MGKFWRKVVLVLAICVGALGISNVVMARSGTLTEEELQMYSQNNIVFYEPCTNTKTAICGTNQNYAGEQVFTDQQMGALEANSPFYQNAGDEYGIPWQVIAVIHMREHGLARSNPSNGQGVYQFASAETRAACAGGDFTPGEITDEQFQIQTNCAAKFLKGKAEGLDLNTDDGIKKLFFRYNGVADVYVKQGLALGFSQTEAENGEGSPYVMNRYDEKREPSDTWGQIKKDGGSIEYPANGDFGAFVYYKAITCDGSDSGGDNASEAGDPCNSNVKGSKNINGTAVALAWPLDTNKSTYAYHQANNKVGRAAWMSSAKWDGGSATEAFNNAINLVYPDRKWSQCPRIGASCDVFSGVSVRYSGYDPNFPRALGKGKDQQTGYAESHSDLWEVIKWDGDKSKVQAGDIINYYRSGDRGHSYVIVQDEQGKFWIAEAGLCRYFGHISKYDDPPSGSEKYIIRAKNAKNSTVGVSVTNGVKSSSTTGTLTTTSGSGNGDINASAIELAWPEGSNSKAQKQKAQKQANDRFKEVFASLPGGPGSGCWKNGKACSVFVNTVLMYAGAIEKGNRVEDTSPLRKKLEASEDWEEIRPSSVSELKPGDVLFYYMSSPHSGTAMEKWNGLYLAHTAIYVETENGGRIAQANHCSEFGYITKENLPRGFSKIRVYRWKKQGNGTNCNLCDGAGDDTDVSLKDGGMSLEDAKKLMAIYKGYAGENNLHGNTAVAKKYYINMGCHGNLFLNCPSFVRYFVNRYTTKQWTGATGNGKETYKYAADALKLKTGSKPQPYAIFSDDSYWPGHTGVVLAVDSAKGTMLVGQAGCMDDYSTKQAYDYIGVEEIPITKYHLYTYLKPIMKTGGP